MNKWSGFIEQSLVLLWKEKETGCDVSESIRMYDVVGDVSLIAYSREVVDVEQPNSPKTWAFLLGMFWVSLVTYYVLWKSYRRIVYMRDRAQVSAYARPQQFTALVRDIPKPVGK